MTKETKAESSRYRAAGKNGPCTSIFKQINHCPVEIVNFVAKSSGLEHPSLFV